MTSPQKEPTGSTPPMPAPEATKKKAWADDMMEEHRQLRSTLAAAREFLVRPRPEPGEEGFHRWATAMSQHLVELYDRMFRHFRDEEDSGMLDDLAHRFPRSATRVRRLQGEHAVLLGELRLLINDVMEYSAGIPPSDPRLRQKLEGVLDSIDAHEHAETELMQRMFYNDVGVGD